MIVIPMAGLSSRFSSAGYLKPKYMLEAHGKTLFSHAVSSFSGYYDSEKFLIIGRRVEGFDAFIKCEMRALGVKSYQIIILDEYTKGQADTVYKGLQLANIADDEPLLIFNIDTFRPGFRLPTEFDISNIDGYLEVFMGGGKNWSNVLPKCVKDQTVLKTAEKQEISNYCCTGLYYWGSSLIFKETFKQFVLDITSLGYEHASELYIAPMYNYLITNAKNVRYSVVNETDVIFCGIPEEYEAFCASV